MIINPNDRIINTKDSNLQFKSGNIKQDTFKATGLWYGIGNSWLEWVEENMPHWKEKHIYKIDVDLSKLLVINTKDMVYQITKKYKASDLNQYFTYVDWNLVSQDYSGVEFNPYFYELRLKKGLNWYNPIDVPSGCIWNKDAIVKITKLQ